MEALQSIKDFYETIQEDPRITVTHISLYMALLYKQCVTGSEMCIEVERKEVMAAAKISSRQTYNKAMNDLNDFGYFKYIPATGSFEKSRVVLNPL